MTLGRSYDEIMSKIQVTDTARERILKRLSAEVPAPRRRVPMLPGALATAACLAILLAGVSLLPRFSTPPVATPPGPITAVPDFQDVASAEALSTLLGFPVSDLEELPFSWESATYTAYGQAMAQIRYENGEQWALFRKSAGSEDNSGDYTQYAAQSAETLDGWSIVLKGHTEDDYVLAIWTDGQYVCSLRLSSGLSQAQWQTLIQTNLQ